LRVQLALLGLLAIYVPVLLLFGVTSVTEDETTTDLDGVEVTRTTHTPDRSPWVPATVVVLGPAAAVLAWWWAGRAVRPLEEAAATQRRLIEETSHELRTPLAVLAINAEVALAQPDPTVATLRAGLERSQGAVARLQATIDQLLVEARGRARTIARRPTDLAALVGDVVDEAAALARPRGIVLSPSGPDRLELALDEPTVRRAVLNLVDNAIRHAPEGSTVEIAVEIAVGLDGEADTEARVVVTDHGPGIPADQQERIFERFWRARPHDPAAPGTGLGLPIAAQVAQAHGGTLTVRSPGPTGDGAVFTLTLRR
jgi:two-component system OmpR family sensor kinase